MWVDRCIDALRSLKTAFLMLGLALGWLLFADHQETDILYVTVHNTDSIMLESVRFEYRASTILAGSASITLAG